MKLLAEIRKVNHELEAMEDLKTPTSPAEVLAIISIISPLLVILLNFVKIFTGAKADKKIDEVILFFKNNT